MYDELFNALARSKFRSRQRLSPNDQAYLVARGLDVMATHGRVFIAKRLAPAEPRNDGKQTPYRGHPIFTAQHATGTCCRSCLEKWHHIPKGRELSPDEQEYVVSVLIEQLARWK